MHVRKKRRYADMAAQLKTQGWAVLNLQFEVGSRGYLSPSVNAMFKKLGLSSAERKQAQSRILETSLSMLRIFSDEIRSMGNAKGYSK